MSALLLDDPLCAVVMGCPVTIAQRGDHNALTGRSVNELVVSDINAKMGYAACVSSREEY